MNAYDNLNKIQIRHFYPFKFVIYLYVFIYPFFYFYAVTPNKEIGPTCCPYIVNDLYIQFFWARNTYFGLEDMIHVLSGTSTAMGNNSRLFTTLSVFSPVLMLMKF